MWIEQVGRAQAAADHCGDKRGNADLRTQVAGNRHLGTHQHLRLRAEGHKSRQNVTAEIEECITFSSSKESFVLSYIAYRRIRASQTVLVSSQDREKLFRIQYVFAYKYMSCILQYLSRCVVGASLESTEEEEAEDENKSAVEVSSTPKGGVYQIVGTLSEPESTKPYFAEETYAVSVLFQVAIRQH